MPRCQTSPRGSKSLGTFSAIYVSVIGPRFAIKNVIFLACAKPKGLKYYALNMIIIVFGSYSRTAHINLCKLGITWSTFSSGPQEESKKQVPAHWRFFGFCFFLFLLVLFLFWNCHEQRWTQNQLIKKITYFTGLFLGFAFSTACKQKGKKMQLDNISRHYLWN